MVHTTTQQTGGNSGSSTHMPSEPAHPQPPHPGLALRCCLGRVQGPLFLSAAVGEGQGQFSCSHDPRISSLAYCKWREVKRGRGYLSIIHDTTQEVRGRASSPTLVPLGAWLLYNSCNMLGQSPGLCSWGQFPCSHAPRARSPTMSQGWDQFCTALRLPTCLRPGLWW